MVRTIHSLLTVVVFSLLWAGAASAQAPAAPGATKDPPAPPKDAAATTKVQAVRDEVDEIFALRKGVVLTRPQQEAYDKLRKEKEPLLRKMLAKRDAATADPDAKAAAVKEFMLLKKQVKEELVKIVGPPPGSAANTKPAASHKTAADKKTVAQTKPSPHGPASAKKEKTSYSAKKANAKSAKGKHDPANSPPNSP